MKYRQLGKWGMKVSEVGLGSWLTYGSAVESESAMKQIHHAHDAGINFIDTANVYARGQSEIVVGKALSTLSRESVVLASKVYFPMGEGPNDRGLSRKHIFEQCHASLKRMSVDYIDLYQCHRYDASVPMFEVVRAMDDLVRQGKILYWGVSEWNGSQIEQACKVAESINAAPPVSNQPCYNMLTRTVEQEVIPVSERLGLGQVVFSPLAQGVLTGKYKPGQPFPEDSRAADSRSNMFMLGNNLVSAEILHQVEELGVVARDLGITMSQLALAWILRMSNVSSVIIGATKTTQIDENLKAADVELSEDVLARIENTLKVAVTR